jgi:uncharacterized membrane protein (UPF0127 family)
MRGLLVVLLAICTPVVSVACGQEPDALPSPTPSPTSAPTPTVPNIPPRTAMPTLAETATPTPTPLPTPTPSAAATVADDALVVRAGAGKFIVEVADDTAERAVGLSGRDSLASGAGMWFTYVTSDQRSFWMRGMRFPIDIVWVNASMRVVHVTYRAPIPSPGATIDELPLYSPGTPIMYVLEINAGLARDLGIEVGVLVSLGND